jgi:hypothetical protein
MLMSSYITEKESLFYGTVSLKLEMCITLSTFSELYKNYGIFINEPLFFIFCLDGISWKPSSAETASDSTVPVGSASSVAVLASRSVVLF